MGNLQLSRNWNRSKEEVAKLQAHSNEFWHLPEPTQCARDEGYLFQDLELMRMEENQLESAATGGGGMGVVHLSSSKITVCLGDNRICIRRSTVLVEEPEQVERERHKIPCKKGSLKT